MGLLFTNFERYNSKVTYLYLREKGSFTISLAK